MAGKQTLREFGLKRNELNRGYSERMQKELSNLQLEDLLGTLEKLPQRKWTRSFMTPDYFYATYLDCGYGTLHITIYKPNRIKIDIDYVANIQHESDHIQKLYKKLTNLLQS